MARNAIFEVVEGADVLIRLSLAHTVGPTEPAPLAGVIFTEAHERHLRLGLDRAKKIQRIRMFQDFLSDLACSGFGRASASNSASV